MAALYGAIAVAEREDAAEIVGGNLHLDVAWANDEALHVDVTAAERRRGLLPCLGEYLPELVLVLRLFHALAAAARRRLDEHGVADAFGRLDGFVHARDETVAAGYDGHARDGHRALRVVLVAHFSYGLGRWADERDAVFGAELGEVGIFREESVARVDGLGAGLFRGGDERRHVEIAVVRGGGAYGDGLVGEPHMKRVTVGGRVDGDGLDAHFEARADDAYRDLASIGDENFVKHGITSSGATNVKERLAILDHFAVVGDVDDFARDRRFDFIK